MTLSSVPMRTSTHLSSARLSPMISSTMARLGRATSISWPHLGSRKARNLTITSNQLRGTWSMVWLISLLSFLVNKVMTTKQAICTLSWWTSLTMMRTLLSLTLFVFLSITSVTLSSLFTTQIASTQSSQTAIRAATNSLWRITTELMSFTPSMTNLCMTATTTLPGQSLMMTGTPSNPKSPMFRPHMHLQSPMIQSGKLSTTLLWAKNLSILLSPSMTVSLRKLLFQMTISLLKSLSSTNSLLREGIDSITPSITFSVTQTLPQISAGSRMMRVFISSGEFIFWSDSICHH